MDIWDLKTFLGYLPMQRSDDVEPFCSVDVPGGHSVHDDDPLTGLHEKVVAHNDYSNLL